MSSAGELPFALGPEAKTRPADPLTIMRTGYEIDKFQRQRVPSREALE